MARVEVTRCLRVLARPEKAKLNPHLDLLYGAIRDCGVEVDAFERRSALPRSASVIHFHWPESVFLALQRGSRRRFLDALITLGVIKLARLRGARLVWTAHNLGHHDDPAGEPPSWLLQRFAGQVDGVIHLSTTGREQFASWLPRLATVPTAVIPRGGYREAYSGTASMPEARAELGLDADDVVLCFFGRILKYKGLGVLVRAFTDLPDRDVRLLIVGKGQGELTAELRAAADGDDRIRLTPREVGPEELQVVLAASNLAVLPYTNILHSGAATLAWSLGVPVLAPAVGAFPELRERHGSYWVRLYDGPLTTSVLAHRVRELREADPGRPSSLDLPAWPEVARQTIDFYLAVGAHPRG